MRIFHLLSSPSLTGPSDPVLGILKYLNSEGHQTTLFIDTKRWGNLTHHALRMGISPRRDLLLCTKSNPLEMMRDIRTFRRCLRKERPDVVHVHLTHDHVLTVLAGCSDCYQVLVRTIHSSRSLKKRPGQAWLLRHAHGLIVSSQAHRKKIMDGFAIPPERIAWIKGAVDSSRFTPDISGRQLKAALGMDHQAPVVGLVARMKEGRGHMTMLKAMRKIRGRIPDALLALVGVGEIKEALQRQVRQWDLDDAVFFYGFRSHDLPQSYATMDLTVLLAEGNDATCRAVLESMAMGRPVVGFSAGAVGETVIPGQTGFLIEPDDEAQLTEKVVELLGNRERLQEMSQNARELIVTAHTLELRGRNILSFYQKLLSQQGDN